MKKEEGRVCGSMRDTTLVTGKQKTEESGLSRVTDYLCFEVFQVLR
jgi:hypothetical protein